MTEIDRFIKERGTPNFKYMPILRPDDCAGHYYFEIIIIGSADLKTRGNKVSMPEYIIERNTGAFVDLRNETPPTNRGDFSLSV